MLDDKRFEYHIYADYSDDVNDVFTNGLRELDYNSTTSYLGKAHGDVAAFVEEAVDKYHYPNYYVVRVPKDYLYFNGKVLPAIPILLNGEVTPSLIIGAYVYGREKDFIENENYTPLYDPSGMTYSRVQIDSMRNNNNSFYNDWIEFALNRENKTYEQLLEEDKLSSNPWGVYMEYFNDLAPKQKIYAKRKDE